MTFLLSLEKPSETFERKAVKYFRVLGYNSIDQKPRTVLGCKPIYQGPSRPQVSASSFQIQPHHDSFVCYYMPNYGIIRVLRVCMKKKRKA